MKIRLGGTYKTREGKKVRIYAFNRDIISKSEHANLRLGEKHNIYPYAGDNFASYTEDGRVLEFNQHPFDLIEKI